MNLLFRGGGLGDAEVQAQTCPFAFYYKLVGGVRAPEGGEGLVGAGVFSRLLFLLWQDLLSPTSGRGGC